MSCPEDPVKQEDELPASASVLQECGTAITPYVPTADNQLALEVGDVVHIIQRDDSGWTFGAKIGDTPVDMLESQSEKMEGWFPDWVVR